MVSNINCTAYMDVKPTIKSQSIPVTEIEEHNQLIEEKPFHKVQASKEALKEQLQRQADQIRESNIEAAKGVDVMAKCMRIAMRIVQGDNVPQKDDQFLAENNSELHMRAWMLRVPKEDPKDHDSELDDDGSDPLGEMINQLNFLSTHTEISHDS